MTEEQKTAVLEELSNSECYFFCYTTKEGKVRRAIDASDQDLANMLFTIFKQDKVLLEVVTKVISVFDKDKQEGLIKQVMPKGQVKKIIEKPN